MAELDEQGTTWAAAKKIAQNRTRWKVTVNGLCSARNSEDERESDLKNPHSEWIHQIKSKSGFLGFMIRTFLWEKIRKEYI